MKLEIWNQEGGSEETVLTGELQLLRMLESFPNRAPFFCQLLDDRGHKLLIGVRGEVGCVQFSSATGDPPYLMALTSLPHDPNEEIDFLMGAEATPISSRFC